MTAQAWIALTGLMLTLLGSFVASIVVLVKTTSQLTRIVVRIESLEKKYEAREDKMIEYDRAFGDVSLLKDGYASIRERQERHASHITQLRITTGILEEARQSQGDYG